MLRSQPQDQIARRRRTGHRTSRRLFFEPLEDRRLLAAFTPGNLVVYRIGTTGTNLAAEGSAVFLDEYTPAGEWVQSIPLPTAMESINYQLVADGRNPDEGYLTRSADGRYLMLTGYARSLPPTGSALKSTTPTNVRRTVGRVDWLGGVNTSGGMYDVENAVHTVASSDGTSIWVGGTSNYMRWTQFPNPTTTPISPAADVRQIQIFGDQLYVSRPGGLYSVGLGLPNFQSGLSPLPGLQLADPHGFFFADLTPAVGGYDTLYVTSPGARAISKYSLIGGEWTLSGTLGTDAEDYRGLTAVVTGTKVTLFATRGAKNSTTGGGELVKLVDTAGFNAPLSGTIEVLATAANQTSFRGVALTPFADNNAPAYNTSGDTALPAIAQNAVNNPGISIVDLIASGGENPITDLDEGALEGIAVFAADDSAGQWQYSLNGGTDWQPLGTVGFYNARLLAADGTTRIRFVPDGEFTGTLYEALRFRAWDQTEGVNGGLIDATINVGADHTLSTAAETATLEILPYVNTPPTIASIADQAMNEDSELSFTFTIDDDDLNSVAITATSSDTAKVPDANIVVTGSGTTRTITIVPLSNQTGTVDITIHVGDGQFNVSELFQLTILPVNDLPTIGPIADRTAAEDASAIAIPLTIADIETAVAELTVVAISDNQTLFPAGSLTISSVDGVPTLHATPAANQFGTADITVTVTDAGGGEASANFLFTISPVNDAPTIAPIADQSLLIGATAGPLVILLDDIDSDLNSLTIDVESDSPTLLPASNVIIAGTGGNRTMNMAPIFDQSGEATITLTVSDGQGGTAVTTFVVTVAPNTPPTISPIADQTLNEDETLVGIPFTIGDLETAADTLTVSATTSDPNLIASVALTGPGANRTISIVPVANQSGVATITVTVTDAHGESRVETFTVEVLAVNDDPTISPIDDQTAAANAPIGPVPFTLGDIDTDAASLVVSAQSDNPALVPPTSVTITGTGANRTLTIVPVFNQSGEATITLTVDDGQGGMATTTFRVTVAPNTPPTIAAVADRVVEEDSSPAGIVLTIGDAESSADSLVVAATASDPSLFSEITIDGTGSQRTLHLSLADNRSGTAIITITVTDINGAVTTEQFTVTVTEVNDEPTISAITDKTVEFNESTGLIPFTVTDVDSPPNRWTVEIVSSNPALVPNDHIFQSGTGTTRFVRVNPLAGQSGSTLITVTVYDGDGGSATTTFTVTVLPNERPTIAEIADLAFDEDHSSGPISITIDDLETPPQQLTLVATTNRPELFADGGIALSGTGNTRTLILTPAANASGTAEITLTVTDADGQSTSTTFTVDFLAVNDPPVASDQTFATTHWTPLTTIFPGSDVDSPNLVYTLTSLPRLGTLRIINPQTGEFVYEPHPAAEGLDHFTFRVSDGQYSSTATIRIEVARPSGSATLENDVLEVTGTPNDDLILIFPADDGSVCVQLGRERFGPFAQPTSIRVNGGNGNDYIQLLGLDIPLEADGGPGDDSLIGGNGDDRLTGGDGNDLLVGLGGDDFLHGGDGDDLVLGGEGSDRLYGAAGDDSLAGSSGDDLLLGGDGLDRLDGAAGNDLLIGGLGSDELFGGSGHDLLIGNATIHDAVELPDDPDDAALFALLAQWRSDQPAGLFDALKLDDFTIDSLEGGEGDDDFYTSPEDTLLDVATGGPLGSDEVF